ncbi:MAG: hemolysin, partial [Hungatella sp.]|nr:hemolysin [Hungatella sp.]
GGLVIGLLDHLPDEGEEVSDDGIRFIVESVDKNRIDRIRMIIPVKEQQEAGESA